jgi:hypothetical protein
METEQETSWNIWGKHVLIELERLNERTGILESKMDIAKEAIFEIKAKIQILEQIKIDLEELKRKQIAVNGVESEKRVNFSHKYKVWMIILTILMALSGFSTIIMFFFKLK